MGDFSYDEAVDAPTATAPQAGPVAVKPLPNVPGYVSDPGYTPPAGTAPGSAFAQAPAIPLGGPGQGEFSYEDAGAGAAPGAQPAGGLRPDNGLGFYQGLMKPLDNAAQGLEWLASKAGVDTNAVDQAVNLPSAAEAARNHAAYVAAQAGRGVRPGALGRFGGEVLATIPATAGLGPLAGGAVTGGLLTDAHTPQGIAFDTAVGAAGGKVADYGLGVAKGLLAPVVGDAARSLLGEGVRLTPGQILGGAWQRVEDGATSIPILGDIIKNAQARSVDDFNRAAINRSLTPIGEQLPSHLSAGHDAVDYAHTTLGKAYDELLPSLTVKRDASFDADLVNLRTLAGNLTPDYARKFENLVQTEVEGRFAPQTGVMTGQTMKEVESQLGKQATRFGKVQDGHAQDYADAVRELQAQLRGLVERSNPEAADRLRALNTGWANLVRVETAAGRQGATGGVFTPSQLRGAVGGNNSTVSTTARGAALMQDLATAGKEVLPSTVPDSGSPFRHALEATVALLVGQEAHALPLMAKGAVAGGLLGSAYTKAGQKIVTPLLTVRPAAAQSLADMLPHLKTPAMQMGGAAAITARQAGSN